MPLPKKVVLFLGMECIYHVGLYGSMIVYMENISVDLLANGTVWEVQAVL